MFKIGGFLAAGLVAGLVIAVWWGGGAPLPSPTDSADTLERLVAVETALRSEERRRAGLEAQVAALEQRLAGLPASDASAAAPSAAEPERAIRTALDAPPQDDVPPPFSAPLAFGPRARFGRDDAELVERFVAAGFTADRAQWIVQRTEELRMEALRAQYDAAREGVPVGERLSQLASTNALRTELGDADYERYLKALDRPTSVFVRDVLSSSPGAQAGLAPGDQVVSYAGKRVFDMSDLNRLVLDTAPGRSVPIEVLREGQPMQLYIQSGPIGITGGGMVPARRR